MPRAGRQSRPRSMPCEQCGTRRGRRHAAQRNGPGRLRPGQRGRRASSGAEALKHVMGQARGLREYLIDTVLDEILQRRRTPGSWPPGSTRCAQSSPANRILFGGRCLKRGPIDALGRLDLVRFARDAIGPVQRKFALAGPDRARLRRAKAVRGSGEAPTPRPGRAKSHRRRDPRFPGAIGRFQCTWRPRASRGGLGTNRGGDSEMHPDRPEWRKTGLDRTEFLAQMTPAIQAFASARLAAPVHETHRRSACDGGRKLQETSRDYRCAGNACGGS